MRTSGNYDIVNVKQEVIALRQQDADCTNKLSENVRTNADRSVFVVEAMDLTHLGKHYVLFYAQISDMLIPQMAEEFDLAFAKAVIVASHTVDHQARRKRAEAESTAATTPKSGTTTAIPRSDNNCGLLVKGARQIILRNSQFQAFV